MPKTNRYFWDQHPYSPEKKCLQSVRTADSDVWRRRTGVEDAIVCNALIEWKWAGQVVQKRRRVDEKKLKRRPKAYKREKGRPSTQWTDVLKRIYANWVATTKMDGHRGCLCPTVQKYSDTAAGATRLLKYSKLDIWNIMLFNKSLHTRTIFPSSRKRHLLFHLTNRQSEFSAKFETYIVQTFFFVLITSILYFRKSHSTEHILFNFANKESKVMELESFYRLQKQNFPISITAFY